MRLTLGERFLVEYPFLKCLAGKKSRKKLDLVDQGLERINKALDL